MEKNNQKIGDSYFSYFFPIFSLFFLNKIFCIFIIIVMAWMIIKMREYDFEKFFNE
jgi:hypothetical protein